jgi:hypothetical protein
MIYYTAGYFPCSASFIHLIFPILCHLPLFKTQQQLIMGLLSPYLGTFMTEKLPNHQRGKLLGGSYSSGRLWAGKGLDDDVWLRQIKTPGLCSAPHILADARLCVRLVGE